MMFVGLKGRSGKGRCFFLYIKCKGILCELFFAPPPEGWLIIPEKAQYSNGLAMIRRRWSVLLRADLQFF